MRRGMLMTVLQQYAVEQPVWRGKPGERSILVINCCVYMLFLINATFKVLCVCDRLFACVKPKYSILISQVYVHTYISRLILWLSP